MLKHIPLVTALVVLGAGWSAGADGVTIDGTHPATDGSQPVVINNSTDAHPGSERADTNQVDQKFIDRAACGGMNEVQSSQIALQKNVPDRVHDFAQHMVSDHQKANDKLADLAKSKGYSVPSGLNKDGQKEMDHLNSVNGDDFVKSYDRYQVKAHDKTIALFEKESKDGKDPDIRQFALDTLPTLRHHRDMLNGMPYVDERSSYAHDSRYGNGNAQVGGVQSGTIGTGVGGHDNLQVDSAKSINARGSNNTGTMDGRGYSSDSDRSVNGADTSPRTPVTGADPYRR